MKVSIITVCYNSSKTIEDTFVSIRNQTYGNIEYIVVDGGSQDSTLDLIDKYQDIISISISEKDEGLYDAINKGIALSSGDIIGVLNSDDVFYDDDVVNNIVNAFTTDVDGVYSDLIYTSQHDLSKISRVYSSRIFRSKLLRFGLMPAHPTFYIRREEYLKRELYDLDYKIAADFELIARYIKDGIKLKYIPQFSLRMREGGMSSGSILSRISQNKEIVRACKKNDIYTNMLFISLKLPYKLLTFAARFFKNRY